MRLYAQSVMTYLRRQIKTSMDDDPSVRKLLFMIPAVPADVCLEAGRLLEDFCAEHPGRLDPLIKVADPLCREWEVSNDRSVHAALSGITERGWRAEHENLTAYRNRPGSDRGRVLVILLVGVDRVTDASSLADFHHCNPETIWAQELGKSFQHWAKVTLKAQSIAFEDDTLDHFDRVLIPVVEQGLADLFRISTLLDELDLSAAQDGRDAEQVLLGALTRLGLPMFGSYRFAGRLPFSSYLTDAVSFFSYHRFIEDRARRGALKAVDLFTIEKENEMGDLFEPSERGCHPDDESFVGAVREFIETAAENQRDALLSCDFVAIRDRLLSYRSEPKTRVQRKSAKKLSGGPIEVVLSAAWETLADFRQTAVDEGLLAHESIREITITGSTFKHDRDGDSAEDREASARRYLQRLVGGVDSFISQWIDPTKPAGGAEGRLKVACSLFATNLGVVPARTGEPCLEFEVSVSGEGLKKPITKRFAWRLPEIQPYRLADELLQWACSRIKNAEPSCLPLYQWPFHEELMLSKDDEEVHRVIRQCIQDEGDHKLNLLGVAGIDSGDPLVKHLRKLASAYEAFLDRASKDGLHAALAGEKETWTSLRKAYERACDAFLEEPGCNESPAASLLFRAFLAVEERPEAEGDRWVWDAWEPSAVITVLHPALLEMLQAHVQFLATCFNTAAAKELRIPGGRAFRDSSWALYVDLAAIKAPLCGLLKNRDKLLCTDVRGEGLVHRIGGGTTSMASLTTRLMLRYDTVEDEGISDAELFRQSRDSVLLCRMLRDYANLHPHAKDGLSIAVFQNQNIQPVIAAVHQYLDKGLDFLEEDLDKGLDFLEEDLDNLAGRQRPYHLSVTFFTESSDDSSVARWISQWKERWEAADAQPGLARYRRIRLAVAHRIVSREEYYEQFRGVIRDGLEVDIAILWDFIGAGTEGNDFEQVEAFDVRTRPLLFPVLERPFCALSDPGRQLRRARVLSNRQFSISRRHSEIMARLSRRRASQGEHYVVLGIGDYLPWQGVVDELHRRAGWVVCIDPNIDERLVTQKADDANGTEAREIVGFGSGVGVHGEANYTISTEQFRFGDVLRRLRASIGEVYHFWSADVCRAVAEGVLDEAQRLSGLSLVRATGRGQYVRDFMAYALTRKMLRLDDEVLCDHLVSLDAYQHWFDSADSDTRPDLLWVVARVDDRLRMHVELRLIECKLALQSGAHLDKARMQIENGLQHLVQVFMPRDDDDAREDDRPDQRYWWLQLYRLIGSTAQIARRDQKRALSALERLADGDYVIEWQAAVIVFWTDDPGSNLTKAEEWTHVSAEKELAVNVVAGGSGLVQRLATGEFSPAVPWGESRLLFRGAAKSEAGSEEPVLEAQTEEEGLLPPLDDPTLEAHNGGSSAGADHIAKRARSGEKGIEVPPPEPAVPGRILLGVDSSGSRRVYWEFGHQELSNRHILIFGTSGMGKTYTIQALLLELGRLGQNSLIVDYTNGFTNSQLESELRTSLNPVQHIVQREPMAINPFRRLTQAIDDDVFLESESSTAQRVAGVFAEVYRFGDQQKSALYQAVKMGIESGGDRGMTLEHLIPRLEEISKQGGTAGNASASVVSKIRPFVDQNPFGEEDETSWERLFTDSEARCHVLQLTNFARDVARLITEFSLVDLYRFYRGRGSQRNPRVVVLDEIQNLDHRDEGPLGQLLTEGRKFGFSLVLATQIMSNLERDERDRLFNAAHKLFFRPADTEMRTYAEIAAMLSGVRVDEWQKRLAGLQKAECYSLGPSMNDVSGGLEQKVFRVQVASLADRLRERRG